MKLIISLAAIAMLAGCATGHSRNGTGLLYTEVADSVTVTDHAGSAKSGQACATNILGLISTGDMSAEAAKKAGGITKVATVDYTQKSYVGVYNMTCTIVRGE